MKKLFLASAALAALMALTACNDADMASRNLSVAADNFEVNRRIVYFAVVPMKGVEYLLSVEGRCSLGNQDRPGEMTVTCKEGPNAFKKHFFGMPSSTPVSFFVEQGTVSDVSAYHSRIIFKPQAIIPDVDFKGSSAELTTNHGDQ